MTTNMKTAAAEDPAMTAVMSKPSSTTSTLTFASALPPRFVPTHLIYQHVFEKIYLRIHMPVFPSVGATKKIEHQFLTLEKLRLSGIVNHLFKYIPHHLSRGI